jgi:hypothetical protein
MTKSERQRIDRDQNKCLPEPCYQALDALRIGKGICKGCLILTQAINAFAEQKMCCRIQCISEEQVHHFILRSIAHSLQQDLHMLLKDVEITQTIFDELRPDQLPRIVPLLSIDVENACP